MKCEMFALGFENAIALADEIATGRRVYGSLGRHVTSRVKVEQRYTMQPGLAAGYLLSWTQE